MNLHVQHPLSLTLFLWCLLDKPTCGHSSHGLVNSRSVFSRSGQLADESSRQQWIFKNHGKYYYVYYYI